MGAKVVILAKSLIPIFLRACAIVQCLICLQSGHSISYRIWLNQLLSVLLCLMLSLSLSFLICLYSWHVAWPSYLIQFCPVSILPYVITFTFTLPGVITFTLFSICLYSCQVAWPFYPISDLSTLPYVINFMPISYWMHFLEPHLKILTPRIRDSCSCVTKKNTLSNG